MRYDVLCSLRFEFQQKISLEISLEYWNLRIWFVQRLILEGKSKRDAWSKQRTSVRGRHLSSSEAIWFVLKQALFSTSNRYSKFDKLSITYQALLVALLRTSITSCVDLNTPNLRFHRCSIAWWEVFRDHIIKLQKDGRFWLSVNETQVWELCSKTALLCRAWYKTQTRQLPVYRWPGVNWVWVVERNPLVPRRARNFVNHWSWRR